MGSRRNDDAKYTEGGDNDHITKNLRKNIELSKYNRYKVLVPHNNEHVKITGVDGEQVRPHKSQTRMRE